MNIATRILILLAAVALTACGSSMSDSEPSKAESGLSGESNAEARVQKQEPPKEDKSETHEHTTEADNSEESEGHPHAEADHEHGHHHDPTGMTFEDAERFAKHFDDPSRDEWQKPAEVVKLLDLSSGLVVADIGAGTGYFLPHLSKAVGKDGKVLGLDVSEPMVEYMRERIENDGISNAEAKVVPPTGPDLDEASVDRIIIVNTWHHIPSRVDYSKALLASLRDGGMIMVVDYTLDSEKGPRKKHKLEPETVVKELENAGLEAQIADETLPEQYIVIGRKP